MREKRTSRSAFILAAIWSAVGLWNAWRFPWLCAEYGGWTFLIVYILCMLLLGIPILMLEISIWRKTQKSAPLALNAINKKWNRIGWMATTNSFFMMIFYAVVFAWCILMCVMTFKFATDAGTTETASTLWQNTIWATFDTSLTKEGLHINPLMLICFTIAWILMYLCIKDWAKKIGKLVKYTVILPVILLLVLAIKGFINNPHLWEALSTLFIPQFDLILDSSLRIAAMWQAFFSLSIAAAIMFVYGSFLRKDSNIAVDATIIAVSDLLISVLSAIVLFTTMYSTGLTVNDMSASGVATAFIIYPTAIVNLTSSWIFNAIFWFIFYFMLCTLAIDSAFSILEAVATSVSDGLRKDKKKVIRITAAIAAFIWILLTTWAWVAYVDIMDNRINQYCMIIIWILEAVLVGRFFSTDKVVEEINKNTNKFKMPKRLFKFSIKYFTPICLLTMFIWQIVTLAKNWFRYDWNYDLIAEILLWWLITLIVCASWFIINTILKRTKRWREILALDEKEPMWDDIE